MYLFFAYFLYNWETLTLKTFYICLNYEKLVKFSVKNQFLSYIYRICMIFVLLLFHVLGLQSKQNWREFFPILYKQSCQTLIKWIYQKKRLSCCLGHMCYQHAELSDYSLAQIEWLHKIAGFFYNVIIVKKKNGTNLFYIRLFWVLTPMPKNLSMILWNSMESEAWKGDGRTWFY